MDLVIVGRPADFPYEFEFLARGRRVPFWLMMDKDEPHGANPRAAAVEVHRAHAALGGISFTEAVERQQAEIRMRCGGQSRSIWTKD